MLTKIRLFYQIRKFYKICGSEIGANFITDLADMTTDNLHDVLFDINEVLEAQADCFYEEAYAFDAWLTKLQTQIINFCEAEKPHHNYTVAITILLVALALIGGYIIGRQHTIRQAELLEVTEADYNISFGDEVHSYTFD